MTQREDDLLRVAMFMGIAMVSGMLALEAWLIPYAVLPSALSCAIYFTIASFWHLGRLAR